MADLLQDLAGCTAIELPGLRGDLNAAAQRGEQRLLKSKVAAKGIDGGDAELRRQIEQFPVSLAGVCKGAASQGLHRKLVA